MGKRLGSTGKGDQHMGKPRSKTLDTLGISRDCFKESRGQMGETSVLGRASQRVNGGTLYSLGHPKSAC